ncbi:MAG: glycosyltransferase family 39 protein, partial [Thermoflexales bacterium]|nr:glycosyltransferase family 39 protein [Thermoflexales bacterium]
MTPRYRWLLILIILLACGLRVFHLDTQSVWYDEGLSIYLAQQPPAQAIALSATTDHPPLHTLLLGGWLFITGDSDFAARYLSVFFGVLMVALTFAVGRKVDERGGLIAAGLMALSPFAVYYSQETRGYTLLTTLVLIATLAFIRLMRGDHRRRIWLIYIASLSAALYTHYFAAFAWAAINIAWLVLFVWGSTRTHREGAKTPRNVISGTLRTFASWLIAQVFILLAFSPWLPNALAQAGSNATYFPGRVTWETVVGDAWRAFTVGEWGDASVVGWVWLALIILGLVVAISHRRDAENAEKHKAILLLLAIVIVPLVLMSGLAWLKPKFAPRYLLPSLPAVVALASVGIVALIDGLRARYCQPASIGLA